MPKAIQKPDMTHLTFLAFVAQRMLGEPLSVNPDGRRYWLCPDCGKKSFCTFTPCPDRKDRYQCFRCQVWGDESDLLKLVEPIQFADYSRRLLYLAELRSDYDRLVAQHRRQQLTFPCGDCGVAKRPRRLPKPNVQLAWADIFDWMRDESLTGGLALRFLEQVVADCESNNVTIEQLIEYWRRFE